MHTDPPIPATFEEFFHAIALFLATVTVVMLVTGTSPARSAEPSPLDLFNSRILPIFRSPKPASCIQCHLASVDLKNPARSLLILKPLSKLPKKRPDGTFLPASSVDPISHMGGTKMHMNDQSYKSFVIWIADYSRVVGNRYASVEDLPEDYVGETEIARARWREGFRHAETVRGMALSKD